VGLGVIRVGAGVRTQDAKLLWEEQRVGIGSVKFGARMGFVSSEVGTSFGVGRQDEELLWARTGRGYA
jgi:hypothetical protein